MQITLTHRGWDDIFIDILSILRFMILNMILKMVLRMLILMAHL